LANGVDLPRLVAAHAVAVHLLDQAAPRQGGNEPPQRHGHFPKKSDLRFGPTFWLDPARIHHRPIQVLLQQSLKRQRHRALLGTQPAIQRITIAGLQIVNDQGRVGQRLTCILDIGHLALGRLSDGAQTG
jgi:hypothetical protein